jgi:hypothetical protein
MSFEPPPILPPTSLAPRPVVPPRTPLGSPAYGDLEAARGLAITSGIGEDEFTRLLRERGADPRTASVDVAAEVFARVTELAHARTDLGRSMPSHTFARGPSSPATTSDSSPARWTPRPAPTISSKAKDVMYSVVGVVGTLAIPAVFLIVLYVAVVRVP